MRVHNMTLSAFHVQNTTDKSWYSLTSLQHFAFSLIPTLMCVGLPALALGISDSVRVPQQCFFTCGLYIVCEARV